MNDTVTPAAATPMTGTALAERVEEVRTEVGRAFIGQDEALDQVLVALLAGGHVLIEGVPGLGKTLLVRALGQALELDWARVQFTPDLMPSDVSGHAVYDPKTESFKIRRGRRSPAPPSAPHPPGADSRSAPSAGNGPAALPARDRCPPARPGSGWPGP